MEFTQFQTALKPIVQTLVYFTEHQTYVYAPHVQRIRKDHSLKIPLAQEQHKNTAN